MKRTMKRTVEKTGDVRLNQTIINRKQKCSAKCHRNQLQLLLEQGDYDTGNRGLLLLSRGRMKVAHRRSGVAIARVAFYYSIVAFMYSVSFLLSTSFLQVEVATAFAFKLPKAPRIVDNFFSGGRSSRDNEQIEPIIQNWSLDKQISDDGATVYSLVGTVTGHPVIPDGNAISTAPLESTYVDIANLLLSISELKNDNANPKFIMKRQSSKYTKLIATVSGTKYALLPPNMKISDAPLLSQGKGASGASSSGQLSSKLSYKDQLSYLEEQTEVVRLLAEREDKLQQKGETAEVIRNAGIITAAALAGAAYFVGDTMDTSPATTDSTVIMNTIKDSMIEVETSSQTNTGAEKRGVAGVLGTSDEIEFAQPAKAILPYLEERIRALEEEQQKLQQKESSVDNKEIKSTSTSKASVQEGISKILTDIKESVKQPDSEPDAALPIEDGGTKEDAAIANKDTRNGNQVQPNQEQKESNADDKEIKSTSTSKASVQEEISKTLADETTGTKEDATNEKPIQSNQQQEESSVDDKGLKSTSTSVQEGISKILTDIKESVKQPDSESDGALTIGDSGTKEDTPSVNQIQKESSADDKEMKSSSKAKAPEQEEESKILTNTKGSIKKPDSESDAAVTEVIDAVTKKGTTIAKERDFNSPQKQPQSQEINVVENIKKIAEDMNVIRQENSKEFETVVSDLAWAGRQVLGDATVDSSGSVNSPDKGINGLAYSALSIFGEDGVALLYQSSIDAMKTVSDAFSLDRMWAELVELSSKMNLLEDPRISELLKKYNFDKEKSVQIVAAASLVAIVGVTTAMVVRSQIIPDDRKESSGTLSSEYTDVGSINDTDDSIENALGLLYEDSSDTIPFDSGMNSWGDTTDFDDSYDDGVTASYEAGLSSSSVENYEIGDDPNASSPFPFATSNWDDPPTTYDDNETILSGAEEMPSTWTDTSTAYGNTEYFPQSPDNIASTWTDPSQLDVIDESNMNDYGVYENPYLGSYDVPTTPFENSDSKVNIDDQSTSSRQNKKPDLEGGVPKAIFSPFGGPSTILKDEENNDQSNTSKTSFSPFGRPSTLPKYSREEEDQANTPKASISPFGGSSTLPKAEKKKDQSNTSKVSFSSFGGLSTLPKNEPQRDDKTNKPEANSSPFGRPSTLPKAGQENKDDSNAAKASASPFGRPSALPKASSSPFGKPPKGSQESEDDVSPKAISSPFGRSTLPKTSSSPFGKAPIGSQESEDDVSPKASSSPFGGPSTLPKASSSPFGKPPKGSEESEDDASAKASSSPFGGPSTLPKTSSSPFGKPPKGSEESEDDSNTSKDASFPFGGPSTLPKASSSAFGRPSTMPKRGEESEDDSNTSKANSSPFGGPSTLPKASSSPFGKPPKAGKRSEDDSNTPKASSSPFGGPSNLPKASSSPSGGPSTLSKAGSSPFGGPSNLPKASSSPFGKPPKAGQDSERSFNAPKVGASPFGGPSALPKASSSPFGKPPNAGKMSEDDSNTSKASSSPFGKQPKAGKKSEDDSNTSKASSSPFGGPSTSPKAGSSPFGGPSNLPKASSSSFGKPPKAGQESERSFNAPKVGTSPFGGPSTLPKASSSPFGKQPRAGKISKDDSNTSKASSSPFGGPSTLPKAGSSPFGGPSNLPKASSSPFGGPSTLPKAGSSPFGGPSNLPKVSSSPFGKPRKAGQESERSFNAPKVGASPFGGPSALSKASSSPFGKEPKGDQESEKDSNAPKGGSSPFGEPSTLPKASSSPFGKPPKGGQDREDDSNTPKDASSPFGRPSTLPKASSSPFRKPPKAGQVSKDDSRSKAGSSPFGGPSTLPKASSSSFGRASSMPKTGQESEEDTGDGRRFDSKITDSDSGSNSNSSDIRIRPKQAAKPQNDMYERMQAEQAMRLAEFERKQMPAADRSNSREDEKRLRKDGEGTVNSAPKRNFGEEKAKIEKERRIIAQERAQLDKEKIRRAKKRMEDEQTEFDEEKRREEGGEKEAEAKELSEEDQKEKERMKEIQRLAREQARFEIKARGLPKEEKSLQEKVRMERLHQLAREQAQFEYDRRHENEKRNEQKNRIQSTNMESSKGNVESRTVENQEASKQKKMKMEGQGQTALFQTADTPSNEENMLNRVQQESPGAPKGEKVLRRTRDKTKKQDAGIHSNEKKMQDRVRRVSESSKEEDVLMGTKKKIKDRGSVFESSRSASKEEGIRGEKARLEQLENLAKKQALYKADRTISTSVRRSSEGRNKKDLFSEESEGQIIDVEVAEDDGSETLKSQNDANQSLQTKDKRQQIKENPKGEKSDLEEKSRPLSQKRNLEEKKITIENEKQTNVKNEKRKHLEAQARQRSKQQSRINEKLHSEQTEKMNNNHITPDPAMRTASLEERTRIDPETQVPLTPETHSHEQTGETKQQNEVANAIMKSDGSYRPSAKALTDTSRMLKEVCGFSLSDYKGSKEFLHKKSNVSVYVGRALSIPVRVSTPGSFIEFSITKKSSEFDLAILAVPDKGYAVDIKKPAPFTKYAGKGQTLLRDTVLVGAASAPCTLQFKFENKHSTLLDKVILSYDIKVTSPSRELLLETRRLRTESCLQVIEEDLRGMAGGSKSLDLKDEITKLEAGIEEKIEEIDLLMDEERRWNALIAKMSTMASK